MYRILVCGGTGFVGQGIVKHLLEKGFRVRIISRSKRLMPNVEVVRGNVFDISSLEAAMRDCDVVINAVQFDNAPFEKPSKGLTYEKVDAEGTENIVRAAQKVGIQRFIYISGAGTSAEKTEPWFKAKLRAEKSVQNSGMIYTIFRPSWIYGPGDRSLNRMIPMIRYSPIVFVIGKNYWIQPVHIDDVGLAVANAIDHPKSENQIYEVGGPESLTMMEMMRIAANVLRKHRLYFSIPKSWMAIPFTLIGAIPALDFITMSITISKNEIEKCESDLHVHFRRLKDGLKSYLF